MVLMLQRLFQYDPEDQKNLEAFFELKGVSWEYVLRSHSSWLLHHVRRFVPPPEILLPRVATVIYDFGPLLCAKSNQPLFNDKAWDISINVLENIRRGFYSDPPGHQLYFATGLDKYGLPTYKCRRGTNAIEGGVHQNVIRWFGAFNAAPDFAIQLLRDYVLYHNLKVRTRASWCIAISNQKFKHRLGSQIGLARHTRVPTTSGYETRYLVCLTSYQHVLPRYRKISAKVAG